MKLFIILTVVLFLMLPSSILGWGFTGHKTICAVAYQQLDTETRIFVSRLSGGKEEFIEGCVWADDARNQDYKDTYEYHFVDVVNEANGSDLSVDCEAQDCVTTAIKRYSVYLRNYAKKLKNGQKISSREEKNAEEGLKFLGHFVGDLHQPLHVGKLSDLGGNNIHIIWRDDAIRLHAFWDTNLPELAELNLSKTKLLAEKAKNMPNSAEIKNTKLVDWAKESWVFARDYAYKYPENKVILEDSKYVKDAKEKIEEQILKASIRLAFLLTEAKKGELKFKD